MWYYIIFALFLILSVISISWAVEISHKTGTGYIGVGILSLLCSGLSVIGTIVFLVLSLVKLF